MRLLILSALLGAATALSLSELFETEWQGFKVRHSKKYSPEVEQWRKKIFMQNSHIIAKHNIRHAKGEVSYKLAMNEYGDLLHHEFASVRNGFKRSNRTYEGSAWMEPEGLTTSKLPKSVDWRKKGAVTPVKNQGQCGSCWSFSTTGSLEGQLFRKTGELVSLSEQNLVDCSGDYGNNGCNGGLMDNAFKYIQENNGIDTEESYSYVGVQGVCKYSASNKGGEDTGFVDIPPSNENALTKAIATVGPVSVAIDASHQSFQFYHSGIYDEPECSSDQLDHGVLVVGYGSDENGKDYYIVKNSWGPGWGEKGFILMARNSDNRCGIASQASYPLV